jgi:ABC-type nitrate/sulfonate/bicarbonate transport system substrate-binding protein
MIKGETFAGVLNAPWDAKATAAGMVRFADHRAVLPNYPGGVFAVGRTWAVENRQLLLKFLSTWNRALNFAQDENNRPEVLAIVAAEEKLDDIAAARKIEQSPDSGALNLPGLQCVLDLRVLFKLTPRLGKELAVYYDESFYRVAIK